MKSVYESIKQMFNLSSKKNIKNCVNLSLIWSTPKACLRNSSDMKLSIKSFVYKQSLFPVIKIYLLDSVQTIKIVIVFFTTVVDALNK